MRGEGEHVRRGRVEEGGREEGEKRERFWQSKGRERYGTHGKRK